MKASSSYKSNTTQPANPRMAEIEAHEVIDVDEKPGGKMPAQVQAHEGTGGDEILSPSMPSAQAKDESQNDPRNAIMYKTTVALLEMRGSRLQVFLFLVALLFINILLVCAGNTFAKKRLAAEKPGGIEVKDWIAFFLWISGIIVINYIIFVYLPRFDILVLMKRRPLYYIHGLKTNASACIYFSVALIAWFVHLRPKHKGAEGKTEAEKTADFVLHVIISLLVGSILWLIKSTLLLVLATSFCCNRFFDRAKESLAQEYVITALDSPPLQSSGAEAELEGKTRRVVLDVTKDWLDVMKDWLTCGVVSMVESAQRRKKHEVKIDIREVMKVPAEEFPLYTKQLLVEAISDSVNWTFQQNDLRFMNNKQEAQKAASRIFAKIAHKKDAQNCSYIEKADLKRYLTDDILGLMLPMLELDKNGRITDQSFKSWMERAYNFRLVLKHAIANNKKLFKRLVMVLDGVLVVGIILLWLALRHIVKWETMILIIPQIAAGAFIFGESTKKAFEGAVYIFLVHPFDIGDCCVIGDIPVEIKHMGILTTTVKKFDKQLVYYTNAALATLPISNYTRNPNMGDSLQFSIDLMTPEKKIQLLKDEIKRYLEGNDPYWQPGHSLIIKEIDGSDKIKMVLNFNHTIRFREFAVRDQRKFELVIERRRIFEQLGLKTEVNLP